MEPNKETNPKFEKRRKIFMTYTVVIQMFFTIIGCAILGFYIGMKVDPEGNLETILTAVGTAVGVISAFMFLHQYLKSEERRNARRRRH